MGRAVSRPDLRQRQGEKRPDWIARVQAVQAAERPARPERKKRAKRLHTVNKSADIIDGYNRDDTGESYD